MKKKMPRSNRILTSKELADVQQPLSPDGYTNPHFDKLYGKEKNPYSGTERDRSRRKIRAKIAGWGKGTNICSVCGKPFLYSLKVVVEGGKKRCYHDGSSKYKEIRLEENGS